MPPSPDEVFITKPSSPEAIMRGTKACTPWATPCTLTPCTHWKSEGSVSQRSRFGAETPALLQRMWQAPWVANTVSARACTDSNFDTSQTTPVTPAPSSCVAAASAFASTSAITTFMPSPRKAFARALPIPLAPPVTTATRPLNSFIADHLLSAGQLSDTVSASAGQDNLRNANNPASLRTCSPAAAGSDRITPRCASSTRTPKSGSMIGLLSD